MGGCSRDGLRHINRDPTSLMNAVDTSQDVVDGVADSNWPLGRIESDLYNVVEQRQLGIVGGRRTRQKLPNDLP